MYVLSCVAGYCMSMPKMFALSYLNFLPQLRPSMDVFYSTKKVAKKLQGLAAGTATWVTNVGNEQGEVLISVVTGSCH